MALIWQMRLKVSFYGGLLLEQVIIMNLLNGCNMRCLQLIHSIISKCLINSTMWLYSR